MAAKKITKADLALALNKDELLEAFTTSGKPDTVEGFEEFLKSKGFKINHAADVYNRLKNPGVSLNITNEEYKMPNKDNRLKTAGKKAGVPALIFGLVVAGITFIVMPWLGLMGGEAWLNLIPASQNWVIPALSASAITFPIGTALAFGFLKLKKLFTRMHYKRNKTATKALKELEKGESLSINDLMAKFEKTNAKLLKLVNTKNPFKMIHRHILDKINRNRFHQIAKYHKELTELFYNIDHTETADRDEKLKPIHTLLKGSEDFILKNAEQLAILFELTGIKLIRETDIIAKLSKYMVVKVVEGKNLKATEKAVNKEKRKRKQLQGYATTVLNGERIIAELCARYEATLATADVVEETIPAPTDEDAPTYEPVEFEDFTDETAPLPEFSDILEETEEETAVEETVVDETLVVEEAPVIEETPIEEAPVEEVLTEEDAVVEVLPLDEEEITDDDAIFDLVDPEIRVEEYRSEDGTRLEFEFIPAEYSTEEEVEEEISTILEETVVDETPVVEEVATPDIDYGYDVEVPYTPDTEEDEVEEVSIIEEPSVIVEHDPFNVEVPVVEEVSDAIEETPVEESKPSLLVKSAKRLKYERTPVSSKGETVGAKLKFTTNDSSVNTEIRWLKTTDQIRIRTIISDKIADEQLVEVTDPTRPPIAQINSIIKQTAHEQHIENVESLLI